MIPQINQSNINEYSSPIISYFNSSNEYLIKKYSEDHNTIDLEKSNNFIRKDILLKFFLVSSLIFLK